jgi:hypothetical protein
MSATQDQDTTFRDDLRAAVAQVAKAHNVSVQIGDVSLTSTENGAEVATIEHISVEASEDQIQAVMQKFYDARAAHAKLHHKKHYRYRMIVAVTVGAGVYAAYHIFRLELAGKGLEYILPAVVDKLIFGIEVAE